MFVTTTDAGHLSHPTVVRHGPTVLSASGTAPMLVTFQGQLLLSNKLSRPAQSAFVLDDLKTGTLISLCAQLCVKLLKNNEIIIQGSQMPNGLWLLPFASNTPSHQANGILCTDKPKQELAMYLHAALSSPAPSTLLCAIRRGHLTTIPGLTTNLISQHLPKSVATLLAIKIKKPRTCGPPNRLPTT
jgi:hypothetical protein